ncbi:MAG: DUF2586 family protein [Sediminibacterium sp.]|nr:DUF2586 family protein [Sediminibacterium sp.]MDP3128822.1 DUF2586 family protein [Sediminibacterium sp.]
MGSIKFLKQNNRLKRVVAGFDHYCGSAFYSDTLPAGFSVNDRLKGIDNIEAAEALGITANNASVLIKIMHYHISELFRINPDAVLFVGIFAEPAALAEHTFAELLQLRTFSNNRIRQMGVWTRKAYIIGQMALLQAQYDDSFNVFAMCEILYSPNLDGVADGALPDYSAATSPNVHVVIAQDGAALGKTLYVAADTYSVGCIGAALGAVSLAKVHENIGWVEKFDMAVVGGELDVPALSNGTLISALSDAITKDEGTLDTKRLIFLKKYPNITGTYFNDSHGAVVATSDYAYLEDNRTIDKAIRGIYAQIMPKVNGPVPTVKGTGKLAPEYVEYLQLECNKAFENMEKDGEISGFVVTIDANQDINATNEIVINVNNTKTGVSRRFKINIGY